ncbi:unnamed protein product [Didymodactylos carnosus]|uniref:carbonyl reductase (NADPH) n=1 Tax=Didymodactylos carnosus TaxID=1234261 RepID=A0A815QNC9_9BILA|nr:unnamed protein product [Didymodactylos carnosus]CAF1465601.1 unnamed protein product [Didymodactylos carnosus]CAF4164906.1 unnamed protein product [Didymodactylos carnosus]CAF4334829.1 unnamed protein product [Didymodactylos carnosus]
MLLSYLLSSSNSKSSVNMSSTNTTIVALITGGNRGIGFEIARQLGQQGIEILIGSRNETRGKDAVEKLINDHGVKAAACVQLDMQDQESIDRAVETVSRTYNKLDILVNNGGIYLDEPPPSALDIDMLRHTFDTNFFGVFRVTKAFLPLIKRSLNGGRIVNVSSALGSFRSHELNQQNFHLAYSASKASLNMLTVQFAKELKQTNIKVNSYAPGFTATEMTNYEGHSVEIGARSAVTLATLPNDGPTGRFFAHDLSERGW